MELLQAVGWEVENEDEFIAERQGGEVTGGESTGGSEGGGLKDILSGLQSDGGTQEEGGTGGKEGNQDTGGGTQEGIQEKTGETSKHLVALDDSLCLFYRGAS